MPLLLRAPFYPFGITDGLRAPGAGSLAAGRPAPGHVPEAAVIEAAAGRAVAAAARPGAGQVVAEDFSDPGSGVQPFGAGFSSVAISRHNVSFERYGAMPSCRLCSPTAVLPSALATGSSAAISSCDGPAAPAGITSLSSDTAPCTRARCVPYSSVASSMCDGQAAPAVVTSLSRDTAPCLRAGCVQVHKCCHQGWRRSSSTSRQNIAFERYGAMQSCPVVFTYSAARFAGAIEAAAGRAGAAAARPVSGQDAAAEEASDPELESPPFCAGRRGVSQPLCVGRGSRRRELQDGGARHGLRSARSYPWNSREICACLGRLARRRPPGTRACAGSGGHRGCC